MYAYGSNLKIHFLVPVLVSLSFQMLMEIRSVSSSEFSFDIHGQPANVKNALEAEIKTFDQREAMVVNFKVSNA